MQDDDVDAWLIKQDGTIIRKLDPALCRHASNHKCVHCLPLDPWDEKYLESKDIKHISLQSHVRQLLSGKGKGTHINRPLNTINCKIDLNCSSKHRPFPEGVCNSCRPPVVTLNRQRFRLVDNISIENHSIVDEFLNYWRKSGHQRIGFLVGKYQPHPEVPLGVKAVVAAIYEPAQVTKENGVELLAEDPRRPALDRLCALLDLQLVGWIFTDLWSADPTKGTVHCTRTGTDAFLLSAQECITAAALQNQHPHKTRFSSAPDSRFGSRFVTVVASGDKDGQVGFNGYQVSEQCAALVDADLLCPTQHPELAWVRDKPKTPTQFLTEVQYTEKNEYGAEVRRNGRPLPVEYLLVDVPAGMPKDPCYTFHATRKALFPIENRDDLGDVQSLTALSHYVDQFSSNQALDMLTNLHALLYLLSDQSPVEFQNEELESLAAIIKSQDRAAAQDWTNDSTNWQQIVALARLQTGEKKPSTQQQNDQQQQQMPRNQSTASSLGSSIASSSVSGGVGGPPPGGIPDDMAHLIDEDDDEGQGTWACAHCTLENEAGRADCAACALPRRG